jgi:hypothetical protein
MMGGFSQVDIEDDHRNMISTLKPSFEGKLGATHSNWHINSVFSQVVAGTYIHFHLTGDNDTKISVLVFVPLPHTGQPATVELVENGHT